MHPPRRLLPLRGVLTVATVLSCSALQPAGGQQPARGPDEVVRAVLRADSLNDWRSLLALAHPAAIAEFRNSVIEELTFDASEFPVMAPMNQCMKDHMARSRQSRLDSIYRVPSVDALKKLPADTLFARDRRWRDQFQRVLRTDPLASHPHYTYLGHLTADDSTAYGIVVETRDRLPMPEWPARRPQIITIRKLGAEWRTMLDIDMLRGGAHVDLISECN